MNREIKFRAWCRDGEWDEIEEKQQFVMIDADSFCFCSAEPLSKLLKDIDDEQYIMQFTGLHDKNGKEIYEGDLLEIPVNEAIREGVHRIYYFKDGFVSSSIFFKEDETANKSSLTWIINRGAFVIGNIFENPELLDQ